MKEILRIETPRLVLRPYEESDAAELKAAIDETIDLLLPWMPWAKDEPQTTEQKAERIRIFNEAFRKEEDFVFGGFLKNGELALSTGLHPRVGPDALETGYWTRKKYQGLGYATEAAYAMTKTGFTYGTAKVMYIKCDPLNHRSAIIPGKLGYTFSGESFSETHNCSHLVFTMKESEFREIADFEQVIYITDDQSYS